MNVSLEGSSPAALTAGILLLSRGRSFGLRVGVEIVGDPEEMTNVQGPALVCNPVLASCGVGRELGFGALVVVPGPATAPIAVNLQLGGSGTWFEVDRAGVGVHPHTQAFVRMCRERDPAKRELGRALRRALGTLGCSAEPAVLDLLFGAPAPPLTRAALALRAGRAMSGQPPVSLTRYLRSDEDELPDPMPSPCTAEDLDRARADGSLERLLLRFGLATQHAVEDWMDNLAQVDPEGEYRPMVAGLAEVVSHVLGLPPGAMLPPLAPSMDAVAVGLGPALGAVSEGAGPTARLQEMFRFLGGRFTPSARHPMSVDSRPPPDGRLARWAWFCEEAGRAAERADDLWRQVVDPAQ